MVFIPKSHDKMFKIYGPKKQRLVLSSMKHPSFSFIIQKLIKRMSTCFYIILYHMSRFPTFLSSSQGIWVGSHKDFSPDSHLYKSPENDLYIIIYIYIFIYTHCLGPWYYIHIYIHDTSGNPPKVWNGCYPLSQCLGLWVWPWRSLPGPS